MKAKKLSKPIAVVLALVLMLSAIPLSGITLQLGGTSAAAPEQSMPAQFNDAGDLVNSGEAYQSDETEQGTIVTFVSNDVSDAATRTYKIEIVLPEDIGGKTFEGTVLQPFTVLKAAAGSGLTVSEEDGKIAVTANENAAASSDKDRTVTVTLRAADKTDISNVEFMSAAFGDAVLAYTMDSRVYTAEGMTVSLSGSGKLRADVKQANGAVSFVLYQSQASTAPSNEDLTAWEKVEEKTAETFCEFETAPKAGTHYLVVAADTLGYTASANYSTAVTIEADAVKLGAPRSLPTLSPTNDLGEYGTRTNELEYSLPGIQNDGDTALSDVDYVLELPAQNSAGEQAQLRVVSFSSGTYLGYTDDTELTVSYRTNMSASWREAFRIQGDLNVENKGTMPSLSNGEYITALKYSFNEMPSGFKAYKAPIVTADLYYVGLTENFTMTLTSTLTSPDLSAPIEKQETVSVYNPVAELIVSYRDIDTDAEIPGAGSTRTTMQAYTKFSSQGRKTIDNYTMPTSGADVHPDNAINYDRNTFSGYIGTEDVTIIHYYKAYSANVMTPNIATKYDPVYAGDQNVLYFDSLGTRLDEESGRGNVPLKRLETTITIPEELQATSVVTPSFSNGKNAKVTVLYEINGGGALIPSGTQTSMNAGDMYSVDLPTEEGQKITAVVLRFEALNDTGLPVDFYSLNRGLVNCTVVHDETADFTIRAGIKTVGYFETKDAQTGSTVVASQTKTGNTLDITVKVPQLISINDNAAARLQPGDKYSYVLEGIASDQAVSYRNYTITVDLPEQVMTKAVYTGTFTGVSADYDYTIYYADGTSAQGKASPSVSKEISLTSDAVDSIVFTFPTAGKTFRATTAPKIDVQVPTDAVRGTQLTNNVNVSVEWNSGNGSSVWKTLEKTFTTHTSVVKAEVGQVDLQTPERLFIEQTADAKIANASNVGDTEIYDFSIDAIVSDKADIVSVTTGSWRNTSWADNALTILTRTENGDWEVLKTVTNFAANETIPVTSSTGDRIAEVKWVFKVAPVGFAADVAPTVIYRVHEDAEEATALPISVTVSGKFGPTTAPDPSVLPDASAFANIQTSTDNALPVIAEPKMTEPSMTGPVNARFCDEYTYTLDAFGNGGDTYLYKVGFFVRASEAFTGIQTGTWDGIEQYDVWYRTDVAKTVTNEDGTESVVYEDSGKGFTLLAENVSAGENQTLTLPEIAEGEKIAEIYFDFGTVAPGFAMKQAPTFSFKALDSSEPAKEMLVDFEQTGFAGYAADETAPTEAEMQAMPYNFSYIPGGYKTTLIKPRVAVPTVLGAEESMAYRAQFNYLIENMANTGNAALDDFQVVVSLDRTRVMSMTTPIFNYDGQYSVEYRTNKDTSWKTWKNRISTKEAVELYAPDMSDGEYITDVRLNLGSFPVEAKETKYWILGLINWSSAYETDDVLTVLQAGGKFDELDISTTNNVFFTPELPELARSNISKAYPEKVYPKQESTAAYDGIVNNTEASIEYFALTEQFDEKVQPVSMTTGIYTAGKSDSDTLRVLYQTNLSGDGWYELAKDQPMSKNSTVVFPELSGEYITAVKLVYGTVHPGFGATTAPTMTLRYTEAITNHSTVDQKFTLGGFIDGRTFEQEYTHTATADFGYVEVELYDVDTGKKIGENGKYYGTVGEAYQITDYPLKGYRLVRLEGQTSGTMADGYTATVKAYYKALPKTGQVLAVTNLLAGAAILAAVGGCTLYGAAKKKKEDEIF